MEDLSKLLTESRGSHTDLDMLPSTDILRIINEEDQKAALAVREAIPDIARAVDIISGSFRKGGRLFYVGAGTSGRLGVLDAFECPPTFGVERDMVQGVIAGGIDAFTRAAEDAEDNPERGVQDLRGRGLSPEDTVVAIAASGRTPYCVGALKEAARVGARTVAVVCNEKSPLSGLAEVVICVLTGPEVLTGSTRMKAGTAQKMVLNMLSTCSMIRMGKAYTNLMVDLSVNNAKLKDRAVRIVELAAGCTRDEAQQALELSDYRAKVAIVMLLAHCDCDEAIKRIEDGEGFVRRALGPHFNAAGEGR